MSSSAPSSQSDNPQQQENQAEHLNWLMRWTELDTISTNTYIKSCEALSQQNVISPLEEQIVHVLISAHNKSDYCTGLHLTRALSLGAAENDIRVILLGGLPQVDTSAPIAEIQQRRRLRELIIACRLILQHKGDRQSLCYACPQLSQQEVFTLCTLIGVVTMGNFMNKYAAPEMELIFHIALERFLAAASVDSRSRSADSALADSTISRPKSSSEPITPTSPMARRNSVSSNFAAKNVQGILAPQQSTG